MQIPYFNYNAKLQAPANDPKNKCEAVPLISTYSSNYPIIDIVTKANNLSENCDERLKILKSCVGTQATTKLCMVVCRLTRASYPNRINKTNRNGIYINVGTNHFRKVKNCYNDNS